jgi:glycosyltransferase involved in cell wall biosynthesis
MTPNPQPSTVPAGLSLLPAPSGPSMFTQAGLSGRSWSRPLRVLHVLPSLAGGGMERAAIRLICGGAGVSPAFAEAPAPALTHGLCILRDADQELLAQCRARARIWLLGERAARPRRLSSGWRLRKVIRRFRPDVVHARTTGTWPDAALATRGLTQVRLLLSFHGKTHLLPPNLKRRLLNRWAAARADAVLAVSVESAEYMQQEWGVPQAKLTVIHNGVDTDRFRPAASKDEIRGIRSQLGLEAGDPVVVCVANLVPIKGHNVLLRAWSRVVANQPAARLLLIGDGPLRGELQALAWNLGCRRSILFTGARPNVPELLRAADLFVLPSRYEACSNAILEAMATGLAVVACEAGGNPELVAPGLTGWLVPPDAAEPMAERILAALGDEAARQQAGHAARQQAATAHTQAAWLSACVELYASLAISSAAQPCESLVTFPAQPCSGRPLCRPFCHQTDRHADRPTSNDESLSPKASPTTAGQGGEADPCAE